MGMLEQAGLLAGLFQGFAVSAEAQIDEGFGDPERGCVTWKTLVDADRHPSRGLVAGIMSFGPCGTLKPHRHSAPEFYFCLEGAGTVTVDGEIHPVLPGVSVYLPPDAEHSTDAGDLGLRLLYVFPVDRLAEVDYRFSS